MDDAVSVMPYARVMRAAGNTLPALCCREGGMGALPMSTILTVLSARDLASAARTRSWRAAGTAMMVVTLCVVMSETACAGLNFGVRMCLAPAWSMARADDSPPT